MKPQESGSARRPLIEFPPGELVLASGSPRRREMLDSLGLAFQVIPADVDETLPESTNDVRALACDLALKKARHISARFKNALVIGADTIVALPEGNGFRVFGKPADPREAAEMLRALAANDHLVVTAFALIRDEPSFTEVKPVMTTVTFRELKSSEIEWYAHSGDPLDKAGGYGIQGAAGAFITKISGSISNVVGLPLSELVEALSRAVP